MLPSTMSHRQASRGFTLIEVMVSLLILAVMATMAWKGLDGIVRSREIADGAVKRTLRLQSVMVQWQADLNAVLDTRSVRALQFDGATLRMTRRAQGGVQVVVWALRSGRWVRWAGEPVTTVGELQSQWDRSMQFQGREPGTLAALKGVQQWQVYFFRGGSWTNAQSSGDVVRQSETAALASAATPESLPMGVRCVLTLGEGSGHEGAITRDVSLASQPGQN
ncbi:MAG TPA: prepilin-type N-terminal cleavage/methylation domain-containing protein [Aquabacterium sp.]|uniref:prepilin-type N-terminal cleavage/methylation domain-containing protein n=1 Tax=Aquabacterium sp. TaxID=1872578 RepID=UPI002DB1E5D0|nr:prepilin-type N-terminal cleavage/methylation domain-containing protein [Aquabacterium sp.]HET6789360.1 prepilin-type N-terminal cleavage/methylation domain-containing protein [Aquabacterium sp.]HEX5372090.1 prepilin-type N-terminal cleavage/methylation domain-containing protein [Aquabacterium sp.]